MKFIRSHKILIAILITFVLIIIIGIVIFLKLSPDQKKDVYGNRLTEINQHQINQETLEKMKTEMQKTEEIQTVSSNIKGRLINIIIQVGASVPKEVAIQSANKTLEYFTEEDKAYYDMQVFIAINKEENSAGENPIYPIIGYKHKTSSTYIWKQE